LGGQNLIEAAACGCPIVMGPHTFNFAEAAVQAEQHGAAIRVPSMTEAWAPTQRWVGQPETAQTAQGAARQWLAQGQGAARACAQSLLSTPHP
jgi:3-deoxy-D-manno-octulosonic-acid transferase